MNGCSRWIGIASVLGLCVEIDCAQAQQTSADSASNLEEVVITAQKRTERLSDVPVSASVLSPTALSNANAGDISDLDNLVPSVNLVGTFNGRVPMGIRGISSNANEFTVGLASGVAIMVDGVPIPSDSMSGNQLEDIKSVEVLKGPQATLGGRTAAAGVINIVTRGPTDQLVADGTITVTNDHEDRINGFLAGPLGERVKASLSVYGNRRDFPINNLFTGEKSDQKNYGARGKLIFDPTEDLQIGLTGDVHRSNSLGDNFTYSYVTPGAYLLLGTTPPPLPPPILATLSQGAVLAGITPGTSNENINTPVVGRSDISDANGSVDVSYRIGDLTLGSTTAYQHETAFNLQDLFVNSSFYSNNFRDAFAAIIGPIPGSPGTWANFFNDQTQDISVRQISEELKLTSPAENTFNYVLGVFYSDQRVSLDGRRSLTPAAANYDTAAETKTYDLYARTTWKITPSTSLVTGLRYNADRLSYQYQQVENPVASANSDNSGALVGDISLQQTLMPGVMGYLTYAHGYAPKVFNTGIYSGGDAAAPTTPLAATGQEHIDHFEIGSKGSYFDQHLQLNASLFYTVYKDYQIQTSESVIGSVAPVLGLESAGKARTEGAELDVAVAATDLLRINVDAAYIDAKFVDYPNAPCYGNGVTQTAAAGCVGDLAVDPSGATKVQSVSGKTMPDSPKFKTTLSAEQRIPFGGSNYEGVLWGSYAYRSSTQFQPDQNPETIQGGFGLLNLSLGVRQRSGKFSITAFCNNIGNHFYAADIEDFWSGPWGSNAVVKQPARDANRYYGVRISAAL
jgi:iron complex outermembrane receptor protein